MNNPLQSSEVKINRIQSCMTLASYPGPFEKSENGPGYEASMTLVINVSALPASVAMVGHHFVT